LSAGLIFLIRDRAAKPLIRTTVGHSFQRRTIIFLSRAAILPTTQAARHLQQRHAFCFI